MEKEIKYKLQGSGFDSWQITVYDDILVNKVIETIEDKDENENSIFHDVFEMQDGKPLQEIKRSVVESYVVYEDPTKPKPTDIVSLLLSQTPEQIEEIKKLLGLNK